MAQDDTCRNLKEACHHLGWLSVNLVDWVVHFLQGDTALLGVLADDAANNYSVTELVDVSATDDSAGSLLQGLRLATSAGAPLVDIYRDSGGSPLVLRMDSAAERLWRLLLLIPFAQRYSQRNMDLDIWEAAKGFLVSTSVIYKHAVTSSA